MPPKRKHPRTGPDSWQNDPDRPTEVNRTKVAGTSKAAKAANREAFIDHPTDDSGRKICFAKISGRNKHCQLDAGRGTNHPGFGKCSLHGGNTPSLEVNAALFAGGEIIKNMSKGFGAPLEIDPHEALLQEVSRSFGIVAFLQQRLDMYDLRVGDEVLSPAKEQLIELYDKQRTMAVRVAKTAIDAGIAEQRVMLERAKGVQLVEVLREVFAGLGLSVEQQKLLPLLVPAALRKLTEPGITPTEQPLALPPG